MIQMLNIMVNSSNAANSNITASSSFELPPQDTSTVQVYSYTSLMLSLLAAFGVLMSKQLFDTFKIARGRRSLEKYGMKRQEKLEQLETWRLRMVLRLSYGLLQSSLIFFVLSLCMNLQGQKAAFITVLVGSMVLVFFYTALTMVVSSRHGPSYALARALQLLRGTIYETSPVHSIPSNKEATIKLSAIHWLLETSMKPDIVEAVAAMVPLIQWPSSYDASAIYTHLRDAFTTYRYNRELFVKYGKAMAHLHLQPAKIGLTLLRQERETWDVFGGMSVFICDAFIAGRSAWEKLRTAKEHDNRLKLKADVRTALRTMVVHGRRGHLSHPDDEKLIWNADLQWRHENGCIPCREEFDWLVDYLMDGIDHNLNDGQTQHDALLALSAMHGLGSDAKRSSYIKALIHCMDPSGPKEVQYAAIRAVSDAREELSSIAGDSMPHGVDAKLLDEFSRALLAVIRPNDVPDGRDPIPLPKTRCYLRLIFALAKNDEWRDRLSTNPDLRRWFTLTEDASVRELNFSELDFYRVGIYLRTYPDGMGHSLVDAQEGWGALTRRAWSGLSMMPIDQDFDDCLGILPALVTETKRNLPAGLPTEDLRRLFGGVDQVLQTVKENRGLDFAILDFLQSFHDQLNGMLRNMST